MTKSKNTKRTLLASVCSVILCVAMLIGSTFAWFTDTASTKVNKIQSGTLDVALEMQDAGGNWVDAEGKTLEWIKAKGTEGEEVLWEPGCTYELPEVRVVNKGNLALKFKVVISGIVGNAKLLEAIDFTYGELDVNAEGHLAAEKTSEAITIKGHMKEEAGNEYQNLSIEGIAITVVATQDTVENDSYGNQYDKDAPAVSYHVTPENIQEYLSGIHGSMTDAKLVLAPGEYGMLTIGAPSKYAESDTVYTCLDGNSHSKTALSFTDANEFNAHMENGWHYTPRYTRTIDNLTLVGQDGVTVAGVSIASGHAHGENVYDPVRDKTVNGSCYFMTQKISNLTFEGINFTDKVNIETSIAETVIDGVTFKKCCFETNNMNNSGQGLRYYNENNNGNVRNLVVEECKFTNCFQGIFTANVVGISITDCSFDTTTHNAIAVQGKEAVNHKAVVIERNTFANIKDRIIRFNEVGADTQIVIRNNAATNSGDADKQVIKATSLADGVTYVISENNWGEGTVVANEQFSDR